MNIVVALKQFNFSRGIGLGASPLIPERVMSVDHREEMMRKKGRSTGPTWYLEHDGHGAGYCAPWHGPNWQMRRLRQKLLKQTHTLTANCRLLVTPLLRYSNCRKVADHPPAISDRLAVELRHLLERSTGAHCYRQFKPINSSSGGVYSFQH